MDGLALDVMASRQESRPLVNHLCIPSGRSAQAWEIGDVVQSRLVVFQVDGAHDRRRRLCAGVLYRTISPRDQQTFVDGARLDWKFPLGDEVSLSRMHRLSWAGPLQQTFFGHSSNHPGAS
jgi:hypothetical protein